MEYVFCTPSPPPPSLTGASRTAIALIISTGKWMRPFIILTASLGRRAILFAISINSGGKTTRNNSGDRIERRARKPTGIRRKRIPRKRGSATRSDPVSARSATARKRAESKSTGRITEVSAISGTRRRTVNIRDPERSSRGSRIAAARVPVMSAARGMRATPRIRPERAPPATPRTNIPRQRTISSIVSGGIAIPPVATPIITAAGVYPETIRHIRMSARIAPAIRPVKERAERRTRAPARAERRIPVKKKSTKARAGIRRARTPSKRLIPMAILPKSRTGAAGDTKRTDMIGEDTKGRRTRVARDTRRIAAGFENDLRN